MMTSTNIVFYHVVDNVSTVGDTKIQVQAKRENGSIRARRAFEGDKKPLVYRIDIIFIKLE